MFPAGVLMKIFMTALSTMVLFHFINTKNERVLSGQL